MVNNPWTPGRKLKVLKNLQIWPVLGSQIYSGWVSNNFIFCISATFCQTPILTCDKRVRWGEESKSTKQHPNPRQTSEDWVMAWRLMIRWSTSQHHSLCMLTTTLNKQETRNVFFGNIIDLVKFIWIPISFGWKFCKNIQWFVWLTQSCSSKPSFFGSYKNLAKSRNTQWLDNMPLYNNYPIWCCWFFPNNWCWKFFFFLFSR